jgi:uncharacterized protein YutE (UPF0331/DUF86 family)
LVDRESVGRRLQRLGELLAALEAIRADGEQAYLAEMQTRLAAERALQLAVQACIDVAAHLVAELGLRTPEDYRDTFRGLADEDLLDRDLAQRLGDAAGMRNILVHEYLEIDPRQVWRALERLDDLRAFADAARLAAGV